MKKTSTLLMVLLCTAMSIAQHSVTLKVIDNQNGALTNKVDDQNEINVFCWAGTVDGTALYSGDWWYPMYEDAGRPGGLLIKNSQAGTWTWQVTFDNLPVGDYKWNPHMKTLGWASIHNEHAYHGGPDLYFSIGDDGTISGHTSLELPLVATNIDNMAGELCKVYAKSKAIYIEKPATKMTIHIFNMSGSLISHTTSAGTIETIPVNTSGIYIVSVGSSSYKVLVK